jgi:hypothetical protein
MSDWTAAWNASPTDSDLVGGGDEAIADTRDTIGDRLVKEHFLSMSEASPQPQQGRHRPGSAVSFAQATAPTLKPDGSAVLDAIDHGRTWIDTDTGVMYFWKWASGSGAWTECAGAHGLVLLTSGTSWTSTWTGPVKVTCVAGGGGSGGVSSSAASLLTASGGGGGGGSGSRLYNVTKGTTYTYAIGAAGVGGASSTAEGGDGAATTFTDGVTLLTALGGLGGTYRTPIVVGSKTGAGGSATNATDIIPGTPGNRPAYNGDDSFFAWTFGGSSSRGAGGMGYRLDVSPQGYGAGGQGVRGANSSSAGIAGTAGCIIIEW